MHTIAFYASVLVVSLMTINAVPAFANANNGHGNGDQDAPGNSGSHNHAENSEYAGQGNSQTQK